MLDGVLSELPEVQRTALEVALLRRPTDDLPADRLFTQAERAELLADATRIRGVIPCAECAGTCAEV